MYGGLTGALIPRALIICLTSDIATVAFPPDVATGTDEDSPQSCCILSTDAWAPVWPGRDRWLRSMGLGDCRWLSRSRGLGATGRRPGLGLLLLQMRFQFFADVRGFACGLRRRGGPRNLARRGIRADPEFVRRIEANQKGKAENGSPVLPAEKGRPWFHQRSGGLAVTGHGYRVTARVTVWRGGKTFCWSRLAPSSARATTGRSSSLRMAAHGSASSIGERNLRAARMLSGLDAGDTVVLRPSDRVQDQIRIQARK